MNLDGQLVKGFIPSAIYWQGWEPFGGSLLDWTKYNIPQFLLIWWDPTHNPSFRLTNLNNWLWTICKGKRACMFVRVCWQG